MNQSIWREVQANGLAALYRDKSKPLNKWIRMLMSMAYLRPDRVRHVCKSVILARPYNLRPDEPVPQGELDVFAATLKVGAYFFHNYAKPDALFPPHLWTLFNIHDHHRTNNPQEGWHNGIKASFRAGCKPNFWVFLSFLKDEELAVNTKCVQIAGGNLSGDRASFNVACRQGSGTFIYF